MARASCSSSSSSSSLGFRGVLLRLTEADEAATSGSNGAFRVLAPDAELVLPPAASAACGANALSARAAQVLVVSDRVSARLLQRTGCGAALLQRETRSALWVESCAGDGGGRSCYCFQFRSGIEFDMFARTVSACLRAQQLALLENSVLLELELEAERRTKLLQQQQASAGPKPPKSSLKPKKEKEAQLPSAAKASKVVKPLPPAARDQQQQLSTACILCGTKGLSGKPLSMHPFVLQDACGAKCHVCKVCLQQILKRRVTSQAKLTTGAGEAEAVCGLCAQHASVFPTQELKKCAMPMCPRIYCAPCLQRLVGKAQTSKVWRAKQWHCPNCTNYHTASSSSSSNSSSSNSAENARASEPTAVPAAGESLESKISADAQAKRKRKRQLENSDDNPLTELQQPKQSKQMQPKQQLKQQLRQQLKKEASTTVANVALAPDMEVVDYAANYFQFLIQREFAKVAGEESEDVCFCCKDGGELVECDWPGKELSYARCPKVYHEDCLGYKVPENVEWKCPRHRCQACGIIALYACRFCVTSYCSEHVPVDVKVIGQATKDMPENKYVMCASCAQHAQRALNDGKLSVKTHSLLLRLPAKRK